MSKIGNLKSAEKGIYGELHGEIKTLQMAIRIKLIPENKIVETAPDYIIYAIGNNGQDINIGGAWRKTKNQIGDIEFEFLSLTIDDPSFPTALNVAAFKNKEGGWDITWRRRLQNSNSSELQSVA